MGEFFTWTAAELGLNVQEMDREHQQLIDKMNALHRAHSDKAPFEKTLALIGELADFTVKHFADEEAYMEKVNFEGLATHKIIHQQLLSQFQSYVTKFQAEKTLNEGFFSFLKVWLTGHIRGIDMKYAKSLKQKAG